MSLADVVFPSSPSPFVVEPDHDHRPQHKGDKPEQAEHPNNYENNVVLGHLLSMMPEDDAS